MSFYFNSRFRYKRAFFVIILLAVAAGLILYSLGIGPEFSGIPLYKLIVGVVLLSWILSKVIFGYELRQRLRLAFPVALLFMLYEEEIAVWCGLPDTNIINNWYVVAAAIACHIAIYLIIPRRMPFFTAKGFEHLGSGSNFSSEVIYIDASKTSKSMVYSKMGHREVYYQNTESVPADAVFELDITNHMGNVSIHIPVHWNVKNRMETSMGNISIRQGGGGATLILTGTNKMGSVEIK